MRSGAGTRTVHARRDSLLKKKSFQKVSEMSPNRRDMRAKIFYFVVMEIHELMNHRTSCTEMSQNELYTLCLERVFSKKEFFTFSRFE